jgi:HAD superfamily hydrolase (TIGR01509 family)
MTPDLVIFDCDGVLIDSEMIYARVDADELTAAGCAITPEDVVRRFAGHTTADMLRILGTESGIDLSTDFAAMLREKVEAALKAELGPVVGIDALLETMHMPRCVASNTPLERLRWCLAHTGLLRHFEPNIFSASQVARPKPAPDLFLHAAAQFGASPGRCLVIEDSVTGVRAARAAGMPALGLLAGSHCWPELGDQLIAAGATGIARSCDEVAGRLSDGR